MGTKDAIRHLFNTTDFVVSKYLEDLSDADLLLRPVPAANHIAWQLGHLINSEQFLLQSIPGGKPIELPKGWAEQHSKETSQQESTKGFASKAEYLSLYQKSRANALANLAALPDADLDKSVEGPMAKIAPTVGAMFVLIGNHPMMHAGQFVVVRRKLGKPVVI
jgi:hypothetical protein